LKPNSVIDVDDDEDNNQDDFDSKSISSDLDPTLFPQLAQSLQVLLQNKALVNSVRSSVQPLKNYQNNQNNQLQTDSVIVDHNVQSKDQNKQEIISNNVNNYENENNEKKTKVLVLQLKPSNSSQITKIRVETFRPFSSMLLFYSQMQDIPISSMQLKFDGMTLDPSLSPSDYYMRDDDLLHLIILNPSNKEESDENKTSTKQNNSNLSSSSPSSTNISSLETKLKDAIVIQISSATDPNMKFRIDKTDPLSRIFDAYCQMKNLDSFRVKMSFDGEPLDLKLTPEELNLEDMDIIDVVISK